VTRHLPKIASALWPVGNGDQSTSDAKRKPPDKKPWQDCALSLVIAPARPALLVPASPRGILLLLIGPMATTALLTLPPRRPLLLLTGISAAALLIALLSTLLMLAALALLHG
jgi:hypothetical protein